MSLLGLLVLAMFARRRNAPFRASRFYSTRGDPFDAPGGSMEKVALRNQIGGPAMPIRPPPCSMPHDFRAGTRGRSSFLWLSAALDYKSKFCKPDFICCGLAGVSRASGTGRLFDQSSASFRNSVSSIDRKNHSPHGIRSRRHLGVQAPVARETREPAHRYGMQTQDT